MAFPRLELGSALRAAIWPSSEYFRVSITGPLKLLVERQALLRSVAGFFGQRVMVIDGPYGPDYVAAFSWEAFDDFHEIAPPVCQAEGNEFIGRYVGRIGGQRVAHLDHFSQLRRTLC